MEAAARIDEENAEIFRAAGGLGSEVAFVDVETRHEARPKSSAVDPAHFMVDTLVEEDAAVVKK
jgi:hypothetical protein